MAPSKNVIISKSKVADPDIFVSSAVKKTAYLKSVIQRTIVAAQKYKQYDVFGANELNLCMGNLRTAFGRLDDVERLLAAAPSTPQEDIIKELQNVSTDLSTAIKSFGTERISDLISICFGSDVLAEVQTDPKLEDKFSLMEQFVHPIGYKVIPWKSDPKGKAAERGAHIKKNRIVEDFTIVESAENFDCFDLLYVVWLMM
jgi:hypothetical protein